MFSSIAKILNRDGSGTNQLDLTKLIDYVNNKVSDNTYCNISCITTEHVFSFINSLDTSKATGLDGIGPKIRKIAANCLSPVIADLIYKNINSGSFPGQLKSAKVFPPYTNEDKKSDQSNYRPISVLPTISKLFERHVYKHLINYYLNEYKLFWFPPKNIVVKRRS